MKTLILLALFTTSVLAENYRYLSVAEISSDQYGLDRRTHVVKQSYCSDGKTDFSVFIRTNPAANVTMYRPLQVTFTPFTNVVVFAATDTNMHIRVSDFLYPDSSNSVSKLRQKYPAAVLVRFTEVKTNVTATIRLMDGTEYQDLWLDEKFGWSKKEIIP